MRRGAGIRRNSIFAFLSRLIRLLTNVLMFVGIARLYGVEAFGQFTTAHTLSTIFLLLADFGFDSLLPTEIAVHRQKTPEYVARYFSLKIVFAVVATIAMMMVPLLEGMSASTETLVHIFSWYVLLASLNNFFFALFKGYEEFHHETRISFITNSLLLILLIVLGVFQAPLPYVALSFVGTRVLGLLLALKTTGKWPELRLPRFDLSGWREVWQRVAVFGIHFLFGNLFFQLDTILLSVWRGDRDVGIYQSAFKVVGMVLILPDIAVNTMMPVLARLRVENIERWKEYGRLLNKILFLVGFPVSILLFVYSEPIITLVYGSAEFQTAIPVLRIFAATVLVRYGYEAYALMLTTSHRQAARMTIVVAGTLINVAANAFFIPAYGPWGAAVVSLGTNVLVGVSYVVASGQSFVQWTLQVRNLLVAIGMLALAGLGWITQYIPWWYTAPVLACAATFIVYSVGLTKEEWRELVLRRPLSG